MPSQRPYRRVALIALFTVSPAAPLVPFAGSVHASGADGDGRVVVESTGDPDTAVLLPPSASVGQTATSIATFRVTVESGGRRVDLAVEYAYTSEVTAIADDGGYRSLLTIDRIALTEVPDGVDPATLGYDRLSGVQLTQRLDRAGRVLTTDLVGADAMSDADHSIAQGFTASFEAAQFVFPDAPVGVGASWTTELSVASDGLSVPVAYRYELTDLSYGIYTVSVSYASDFEATIEGAVATGTVAGLGRATGSVANPLNVSVDLGQTIVAATDNSELTVAVKLTTESGSG